MTTHSVIPSEAIDIGFFSTKVTLGRGKGSIASEIATLAFPSLAPRLNANTDRHLPGTAELDGVSVTVKGMKYFVGPSSTHMMDSRGGTRSNNQSYCLTDSYKALFLGSLYYIAQKHHCDGSLTIQQLVMGLPLNTVFDHANSVIAMASGDHTIPSPVDKGKTIKVHVKSVTVVAQPQGAIINYAHNAGKSRIEPNQNLLVLDMGGGTFDWFVCNGAFLPNYNLCGAAPIGSLNCAAVICDQIDPTFKESAVAVQRIDSALRENDESFSIGGKKYMMKTYWPFVEDLLSHAIGQMTNQVGNLGLYDHILLTGGGAGILKRASQSIFKEQLEAAILDADPVFSNVKGFFEIAELLGE